MKCEGTREEVIEMAMDIHKTKNWYTMADFAEQVVNYFDSKGWITKPKWEQAKDNYNNAIGTYKERSAAVDAIKLLSNRIVELEKQLNGKIV